MRVRWTQEQERDRSRARGLKISLTTPVNLHDIYLPGMKPGVQFIHGEIIHWNNLAKDARKTMKKSDREVGLLVPSHHPSPQCQFVPFLQAHLVHTIFDGHLGT